MTHQKAKNTMEDPPFFDQEEQDLLEPILDALENGTLKSEPDFAERKAELERKAREDLATKQAISVRIQRGDLLQIKQLAKKDGIPYQTLIGSIIHRYAEGTLKRDD